MVGVAVEAERLSTPAARARPLRRRQPLPAQAEGDVLAHGGHHDLRVGVGEAEAHQAADRLAVAPRVVPVDGDGPAGRARPGR